MEHGLWNLLPIRGVGQSVVPRQFRRNLHVRGGLRAAPGPEHRALCKLSDPRSEIPTTGRGKHPDQRIELWRVYFLCAARGGILRGPRRRWRWIPVEHYAADQLPGRQLHIGHRKHEQYRIFLPARRGLRLEARTVDTRSGCQPAIQLSFHAGLFRERSLSTQCAREQPADEQPLFRARSPLELHDSDQSEYRDRAGIAVCLESRFFE